MKVQELCLRLVFTAFAIILASSGFLVWSRLQAREQQSVLCEACSPEDQVLGAFLAARPISIPQAFKNNGRNGNEIAMPESGISDMVADARYQDLWGAVVLDPASSFRWADLGEAAFSRENRRIADLAMARAVALGPNSTLILLRAANYRIQSGDPERAMELLRRILGLGGEVDGEVFSLLDRFGGSTERVLASGIPDEKRPAQAYFKHVASGKNPSAILQTWQWLAAHRFTDPELAIDCVNALVRTRQYAEAQRVWSEAAGPEARDYPNANLFFNGDLAVTPKPVALDWSLSGSGPVEPRIEDGRLVIAFPGTDNVNFQGVAHRAVVPPGRYRFSVEVEAEGITTDQGVFVQVTEAESGLRLETPQLKGTVARTTQELPFTISGQTRLIELRVVRRASDRFDNKIAGKVWVDKVAIVPVGR